MKTSKTNLTDLLVCAVFGVLAIVGVKYSQDLRTSEQGLQLIANAEGCVRNPYHCPSDVLTVGIGTTSNVEQIDPNKIYSLDEIARLYAKGIKQAEECVNQYANGQKMPNGAFDALVSITYNIGCGTMRKSTLFRLANQGYSPAMCDQFSRWVYSNGKVLKGLVERRKKERALCLAA